MTRARQWTLNSICIIIFLAGVYGLLVYDVPESITLPGTIQFRVSTETFNTAKKTCKAKPAEQITMSDDKGKHYTIPCTVLEEQ